jgi:hypothetical protein
VEAEKILTDLPLRGVTNDCASDSGNSNAMGQEKVLRVRRGRVRDEGIYARVPKGTWRPPLLPNTCNRHPLALTQAGIHGSRQFDHSQQVLLGGVLRTMWTTP